MRKPASRETDWWRAGLYALLLHAVLALALFVSWRIVHRPAGEPAVIQASVVEQSTPLPAVDEAAAERERAELKRQQQTRLDAERKRLDDEKRKLEQAQREKDEAARKFKAAEAEKQKRIEAERRKQQEADKRLAQQRQQAQQALREQLEGEERERAAAQDARLASDREKYIALIVQRVTRNWARPPASNAGLKCTVRVRQTTAGEVLEAVIVESSGDAIFDRSVENAVFKASPLPAPENPAVFDRDLRFIFRPS